MYDKNMDKLFTLKETAKILRVSERSVLRYLKAGKLKAAKLGVWRIMRSDIEKFLENTSNLKKAKHEKS